MSDDEIGDENQYMSSMVKQLLQFRDEALGNRVDITTINRTDDHIQNDTIESAKEVRSNIEEAEVGSKDASNLWATQYRSLKLV